MGTASGFLKNDETIEECALREITEETRVNPTALMPVGVFSKPNRDPRGRILSYAYASILCEAENNICGSDYAIDARWFDVSFKATPHKDCASDSPADFSSDCIKATQAY